ncbi:hypothetical protein ACLBR5_24445 [Escherichia coli]
MREGNGPTLFCFHPASGFAWQFSVLRVISIHNGRLLAFSRRALMYHVQTATNLDESLRSASGNVT